MSISIDQLNAGNKSQRDCREMEPTETKPDCSFMRCQIGKFGATREGERTFHLMATARTWPRALEVYSHRRK